MKKRLKKFPEKVVLASESPRRKEMLEILQIDCEIYIPRIVEKWKPDKKPRDIVCELATRKAEKYRNRNSLVIGMDTLVVVDRLKLGKPVTPEQARAMLQLLSGRAHQVITGVCLKWQGRIHTQAAITEVQFRKITEREIDWYIKTGEPFDKAGAYAIQGMGRLLIDTIHGCYYNVVGFPLSLFQRLLKRFHLSIMDLRTGS